MDKLKLYLIFLFIISMTFISGNEDANMRLELTNLTKAITQEITYTNSYLNAASKIILDTTESIVANHTAKRSVVRIFSRDGIEPIKSGSGFFISLNNKTYLITARHVLSNPKNLLRITDSDANEVKLTISKTHVMEYYDATIFELTGEVPPSVSIIPVSHGDEIATNYKDCIVYGYPGKSSLISAYGKAKKSFVALNATTLLEGVISDCKVRKGMSGGPVLVNGKVVGVNSFFIKYKKRYNFHVDMSLIINTIKSI